MNLYDDALCPVCGYYCLGKGGHGCIDKPSLCGYETIQHMSDKPRQATPPETLEQRIAVIKRLKACLAKRR